MRQCANIRRKSCGQMNESRTNTRRMSLGRKSFIQTCILVENSIATTTKLS